MTALAGTATGAVLALDGAPAIIDGASAGAVAGSSTRVLLVRTTQTRHVVVPACDGEAAPAEVARHPRDGDTVLTLRRGTGPRLLRIRPCPRIANVVLTDPAVQVGQIGAPVPESVPLLVLPRSSRARVVVVPRCAAVARALPGRTVIGRRATAGRIAVAPACGA